MKLGELIKSEIEKSGKDISEVAKYAGVSTTTMYRVFSKDTAEIELVRKVASCLNIPISVFIPELESPISTGTEKDKVFFSKMEEYISTLKDELSEYKKRENFLMSVVDRLTSGGGGVLVGKHKPVSESLLVA